MSTHTDPLHRNYADGNALEPTGELAASIRMFREAMHYVAARETSRPVASGWLAPARRRRRSAQRQIILAWTCAALLLVGALPLSKHLVPARKVAAQPAVAQTQNDSASDTALLEQVDTAVSEDVPTSLAPLAALDNWNSTTSANELTTQSSLNKTETK